MTLKSRLGATIPFAVLFAAGAVAAAETPAPQTVDTVVVTAQKRTQALQDVPIVVNVASAQQLRDQGVKDIKDLQLLTPGLTVTSTSSEVVTTARIRGVGTVGDNPGLESSVGVVIDGVYRPRNGVSFGDLGEVERIEVLKGPQGTLFGKSTSAGVINVITKGPSFKPSAEAEATAGNYSAFGGSLSLNGPLVEDKVAGRLYVAGRQRDGFLSVRTGAGPRTNNQDTDQGFYTARGQLLIRAASDLDIRLIADYTKRDESCCAAVQISEGSAANSRAALVNATQPGTIAIPPNPDARVAYSNRDTTQKIEDKGVSAQLDWSAPQGAKVTSVTAYREWNSTNGQDGDFTAADITYRPADGRNGVAFKTFSEEARISGEYNNLNWLAGLFYADEKLTRKDSFLYGSDYYSYFAGKVLGGAPALIGVTPATAFQSGNGSNDRYSQDDSTFALFTNDTYAITKQWDVTVGLRYTWDKKKVDAVYTTSGSSCQFAEPSFIALAGVVGPAAAGKIVGGLCLPWENSKFDTSGAAHQSKNESELSGTLKTSYRWSPRVMTYASFSHGYKAGGFNLDRSEHTALTLTGPTFVPDASTAFAAETVNSYELGAKTQFFGRKVTINTAYFYQDFRHFQLNTFLGTSFVVKSLPQVISQGVDIDGAWRTPIDGLSLQGGATYANTVYSKKRPVDPDFCSPGNVTPPCGSAAATGGALNRLPGSRLSFAPLWSLSANGAYERDVPQTDLTFRGSVGVKWTSEYNTGSDLAAAKLQPAFALVNARAALGTKDGRYTFEIWALNLFDKTYKQVAFNGPLQGTETDSPTIRTYDAFLGAPQTYGATFRVKY
jgi:iron complex outermembrane recepter protein